MYLGWGWGASLCDHLWYWGWADVAWCSWDLLNRAERVELLLRVP